jgi:hypothetical protein
MSDTISWEWIGAEIRKVQADQRTIRSDLSRIERRLETVHATMFTREDMHEFLRAVQERIAAFEALVDTRLDTQTLRFDLLDRQMDALAAAIVRRDTGTVGEG